VSCMPSLVKAAPASLATACDGAVGGRGRKEGRQEGRQERRGDERQGEGGGPKRKRDASAAVAETKDTTSKKAGKDKPAKAVSNGSAEEKPKKVKRTKKEVEVGAAEETPKKKKAKKGAGEARSPMGGRRGVRGGGKSADEADPLALTNFAISGSIRRPWCARASRPCSPSRRRRSTLVLANQDLVARARTGQGKTLAFVLPILECLLEQGALATAGKTYGRPPRVIVLAPTRELAKQVSLPVHGMNQPPTLNLNLKNPKPLSEPLPPSEP